MSIQGFELMVAAIAEDLDVNNIRRIKLDGPRLLRVIFASIRVSRLGNRPRSILLLVYVPTGCNVEPDGCWIVGNARFATLSLSLSRPPPAPPCFLIQGRVASHCARGMI